MRRDVVNASIRTRRQLRFVLADRYRQLLDGRYVALATTAAAVIDCSATVASVRRRRRVRAPRQVGHGDPVVLDAVLAGDVGRYELSATLRHAPDAAEPDTSPSARLSAVRDGVDVPLGTVVVAGRGVLRLNAELPVAPSDGATWTVHLDGSPLAVAGTVSEPLGTDDDGHLTVRLPGRAESADGIEPAVTVGIRTVLVTWAGEPGDRLVLVPADGSPECSFPAAADNTAAVDVTGLANHDDTTWTGFVERGDVRRPLVRPAPPFPALDAPAFRLRMPLPAVDTGLRTAEVGYSPGNHLQLRIRTSRTRAAS